MTAHLDRCALLPVTTGTKTQDDLWEAQARKADAIMCFTLGWVQQVLVWLVIAAAIVAIIKLLIPMLASMVPAGGTIAAILNIVLWAVIAIVMISIIFSLLSCLSGGVGFHLMR